MPLPQFVEPVALDGSNGPDARFPFKTGDFIAVCIFMGAAESGSEYLYRFRKERVVANDRVTGSMVITFSSYDGELGDNGIDVLDPSWADLVVEWDDSLPTTPTLEDSIPWQKLDPHGFGGPRKHVSGVDLEVANAAQALGKIVSGE